MSTNHKQTRRSLSISGELYEELKIHCAKEGTTQSGLVERLMREHLGMEKRTMGRPRPAESPDKPVEVVRSRVTVKVNPKAKQEPVSDRPPPKELAYGMSEDEIASRRVTEADRREAGNIFTF